MNAGGRGEHVTPTTSAIVLTGGGGFVGQRLLRALALEASPPHVLALSRRPDVSPPTGDGWLRSWTRAPMDLTGSPSGAPSAWPDHATVVHLAAATGLAPRSAYRAINVEGTRRMLAMARERGASHFIFVSSVAATYADRRWSHYAESKREAEALVRASEIPWTIVRPTMIFGPGSPNQRALHGLACSPLPLVLGSGRIMVQPVHVDDVALALTRLLRATPLRGAVSLGGRDRVSMRELLIAMRRASGRGDRRLVSVPLGAVRRALGVVEPLLGRWLPVSAGQLAAFLNDAVAEPSVASRRLLPEPRGLKEMLAPMTDARA